MTTNETRSELSYDGCGINGPDEYRERLATFTHKGSDLAKKYGPMMAAAPDLLVALRQLIKDVEYLVDEGTLPPSARNQDVMIQARAAIAKATT